ncbi:PAS domain S-box protein, partial [Candidatus Omnitrophota bacterium]
LNIAGVMVVVIDREQKVTLINKKGCEVLGYPKGEVLGRNWFDKFLPKNIRKDVKAVFNKLIDGKIEPVEYFENPVLTKDGEERIIAWHNTVLRDEKGDVTASLSSGSDVTETKRAEEAIRSLIVGGSSKLGEEFFTSMAIQLARALEADYAFIGEISGEAGDSIQVLSVCVDGKIAENFEYNLKDTPCHKVLTEDICTHVSGAWRKFPKDTLLREMNVEGYTGVPLFDSRGAAIGIMVGMFRKIIKDPRFAESVLRMFAARAAAEIERKNSEEELRASHIELKEQKEELERKNIALKEVLSRIEIEKKEIQDHIRTNMDIIVGPILQKLRMKGNRKYVDLLRRSLDDLTSAFGRKTVDLNVKLTSREIEICNMIRNGMSSKDISRVLSLAPETVRRHRNNIRTKLGLVSKKINLTSYLQSI